MDDALALDGIADRGRLRGGEHLVQFYEADGHLGDACAEFLAGALESGGAAVVVADAVHRDLVATRLRARGLDLEALAAEGRYAALDAAQTLARFLVDGWPDARLFEESVAALVADAARAARGAPVRVFGEMVAQLWAQGKREAAIHLERLWNDLGRRCEFSLLCAYPVAAFDGEADGRSILQIWTEHGHVVSPAD